MYGTNGTDITITTTDGDSFNGYLSKTPAGRGPGLLVIQEIFGVNPHIRRVADDYAAQGYVVLAPDLFWRAEAGVQLGYTEADVQRGRALRAQISPELMVRDLAGSAQWLRKNHLEANTGIGAVGYCMGGRMAFELAATGAVAAAIDYYGAGTASRLELAPQIKIPLQFHFGGRDTLIPQTEVAQIRAAFAGRDNVEVYVYDGSDHGFNCDERGSYDHDASELARIRTLEFLQRWL